MNIDYTQLNLGKHNNPSGQITEKQIKVVNAVANSNLTSLSAGQVFTGQITDIRNGFVSLALDQQTIQAKFEGSMNLCIGEVLQFVVKENVNNRLVLTPYQQSHITLEEKALYKALEGANLPGTDKNIDLVSILLNNQMAVDKNSIHRFISLSLQYPETPIETLVSMSKYNIEITKENIAQFSNYKSQEHQLTADMKQLATMLPETIEAVFEHMGAKETSSFLENLINTELKNPYLADKSVDNSLLHQVIKQLNNIEVTQADLKNLLQGKEFQKALQEELLDQWSFRPEQLSSSEIESKYQILQTQLQFFTEQLQNQSNRIEPFISTVKNMKDNINFMKNLNENFIYTQLPLKLSNQITHSDLYVYTNKKAGINKKDGIHLLLHLDMENLGQTDISIKMLNSSLNLNFSMGNHEAVDLLDQHMEALEKRLSQKGYLVQWEVIYSKNKEPVDFVRDFLAQGETKSDVKHYSFDMRV